MTDTSPAAVAARVAHMRLCLNNHDADLIEALASQLSAANARADTARDAALVEAAERFPDGRQPWPPKAIRKAIDALRDKPAPAVTVQEAAKIVEEYLKDNYSKLTYAQAMELDPKRRREWTAWLYADGHIRAIAGGGDE